METAREVHYPVSGNCPGKQTGTSARHRLKRQHYLLLERAGGREPAAHVYRLQLSFTAQKTPGTFISKITAEDHPLSIRLSTVCFIYNMKKCPAKPQHTAGKGDPQAVA